MKLFTSHLGVVVVSGSLLLSACAANKQASHQDNDQQPLWHTHQELARELEADPSFSRHERFISEPLLKVINGAPQEENSSDLVRQVAVPLWFESVAAHFEGEEDNKECLVTNGISVEGDPISAATEYQNEDSLLKIRAVEIRFFESSSDWPKGVWCPVRPETFL